MATASTDADRAGPGLGAVRRKPDAALFCFAVAPGVATILLTIRASASGESFELGQLFAAAIFAYAFFSPAVLTARGAYGVWSRRAGHPVLAVAGAPVIGFVTSGAWAFVFTLFGSNGE